MAESGIRARSEEKRRSILGAARELFLEHGFSDVSMDAVTARAGVSKATVYGHFATKEELFAEVIRQRASEVVARLDEPFGKPSGDPRADLEAFSEAFQASALVPEARAWQRLVIAEAQRRPQLAQALYESGPAKVLAMLEKYLKCETAAGRLRVERPAEAAEQLVGLNVGIDMIRGLLASQPKRSERERKLRARRAVAVFLAAYGPTSLSSSPSGSEESQ